MWSRVQKHHYALTLQKWMKLLCDLAEGVLRRFYSGAGDRYCLCPTGDNVVCSSSPISTSNFCSTGDNLQFDSGKQSCARSGDLCTVFETERSHYIPPWTSWGLAKDSMRRKITSGCANEAWSRKTSCFLLSCPLMFIVSSQLVCELRSRLSSLPPFMWHSCQIAVIFNLICVWSWFHFSYSSQPLESRDK